jgi:hypothetical protein
MRLLDTDDVQDAWKSVAKKIGVQLSHTSHGKVTHKHLYRDEEGDLRYAVFRYEDGSASYRRYIGPGFLGRTKFKPGLNGTKRMLYNLPEVIAADVVLLVEGEKKADILTELGLVDSNGKGVAVTATGGTGSWRADYVEYLMGKRLVFLPDADTPGQKYSAEVQASLRRVGIQFKVVDFAGHGNDFREYLAVYGAVGLLRFIKCDWLISPEDRQREEDEATITI